MISGKFIPAFFCRSERLQLVIFTYMGHTSGNRIPILFFRQSDLRKYALPLLFILAIALSCRKKDNPGPPAAFSISGNKIYQSGKITQFIGANAFHVFGAGGSDMNSWQMDIAREFTGNVKEQPLTGPAILDQNGAYLHSLQEVVDSNRLNHRITILCPFGWDGKPATLFTGTRPTLTSWWSAFTTKLQQWAAYFKDQPDVWLEVWNEPYRYDRADGYTDDIWLSDMNELTRLVRDAGNQNILLIPCAEQGQDESVLLHKAAAFLSGKHNILFDVHAYEKWLTVPVSEIGSRLQQLRSLQAPVIFGETAPMNASTLMNPGPFLDSVYANHFSVCAWVWKSNSADQDALLDNSGLPNNNNNNLWGTIYQLLSTSTRNP